MKYLIIFGLLSALFSTKLIRGEIVPITKDETVIEKKGLTVIPFSSAANVHMWIDNNTPPKQWRFRYKKTNSNTWTTWIYLETNTNDMATVTWYPKISPFQITNLHANTTYTLIAQFKMPSIAIWRDLGEVSFTTMPINLPKTSFTINSLTNDIINVQSSQPVFLSASGSSGDINSFYVGIEAATDNWERTCLVNNNPGCRTFGKWLSPLPLTSSSSIHSLLSGTFELRTFCVQNNFIAAPGKYFVTVAVGPVWHSLVRKLVILP